MAKTATYILLCVLILPACTGSVTGASAPASSTGQPGSQGGKNEDQPGAGAGGEGVPDESFPPLRPGVDPFADESGALRDGAGEMPLRRLSRFEYANTIRELFSVEVDLAALPPDAADSSGFLTGPNVSPTEALAFRSVAEVVAKVVLTKLPSLLSCMPTTASQEEGCATEFIRSVGKGAFRRPLTDAEVGDLVALYRAGRADARLDWKGGIGLIVQGLLQSPRFLYHWELGSGPPKVEGGLISLSPYEVASRLSYMLTQSMPDAELFAAADSGALNTREGREAQARRLMKTPAARLGVVAFLEQWLGLLALQTAGKDTRRYPDFGPALLGSMQREARAFLAAAVFDEEGTWDTLLSAPFSFVDENLAKVYRLNGFGAEARRTDLDPTQRSGILTLPALLSVHASAQEGSPIKRGHMIRERMLCQVLPPLPDDVPPLAPIEPNMPTREHFAAHSENPACNACHRLMDPLGFGLLHYDAIGVYQTTDGGKPVDASGTIVDIDGKEAVPFEGAAQLADVLANSIEVQACLTRQTFRYALGRREVLDEGASLSSTLASFQGEGGNMLELFVKTASSNSFAFRKPSAGEVLQ